MRSIDHLFEKSSRALAQRTSRRSLLGMLGQVLTGAALIPLLPIDRSAGRAAEASTSPAKPKAAKPAKRRSTELRLLEVLRRRRLSLRLLRRFFEFLSARHHAFADHLDWNLPQPRRRPRLHHFVQRLLREGQLRQLRMQPQRAREADVPALAQQ